MLSETPAGELLSGEDDDMTQIFFEGEPEETVELVPPSIPGLRGALPRGATPRTSSNPPGPDGPTLPRIEVPKGLDPRNPQPGRRHQQAPQQTPQRPRAEPARPPQQQPPQQQPPRPQRREQAEPVKPRHDHQPRSPSPPPAKVQVPQSKPPVAHAHGLVPRTKAQSQRRPSAEALAEAHALGLAIGPADATVIGYAASVTGFHELEVMGRPIPFRRPRLLVLAVALALGLSMTLALATMLLSEWTQPSRIALFAAVAILVVATLSSLMASAVWKRGVRGAVIGASWGALSALGCPLVAIAWATPEVRAQIVGEWQGYSATLHDALEDPSDLVKAAACETILRREDVDGRRLLLPMLTVHPQAATPCLTASEGPMATELANLVAERWSRALLAKLEPDDDGSGAKELATSMASLPLSRAQIDLRLLNCTFAAPTPIVRTQCSDVLAATVAEPEEWVSRLENMAGRGATGATARGISAMAFGSTSLEPHQKKLATRLDAGSDKARWQALELASEAIAQGAVDPIPELAASLEGKCRLDIVNLPRSRDTWFALTSDAILKRDEFPRSQDALCSAATNTLLGDAVENSVALVHASIRRTGREAARGIDGGWLMLNKHTPQTQGDLRALVPPGMTDEQAEMVMKSYSLSPEMANHPLFVGEPAQ